MVTENSLGHQNYEKKIRKKIIIMVPYPAQGHVTPMLKLASYISNLGLFQPLIVLPEFIHRRINDKVDPTRGGIQCVSIPDGLDEGKPCDFFAIESAMEDRMPAHLSRWMRKMEEDDGEEVWCMIVDVLASWAIEVGREFRVEVVGFWPAMVATYFLIASIPKLVQRGLISETGLPLFEKGKISFHPNQPSLNIEDLPWLIGTQTAKRARFKFWARTMHRSGSLKWILANSFPEQSPAQQKPRYGPILHPIGPLSGDGLSESPSFWAEDRSCLDWLDQQRPNSVVYISFGSWVSPIGEAQVGNLAVTLQDLRQPFIWALGPAWRSGLTSGYFGKISNYGKIVAWAPQLDVLKHKAVGCYLTHCGWNSTMEAIQYKKNLLCFPVAGDQSLNCEYIINVWKIGIKINGFGIKEVGDGIKRVMEDREMKIRIEELNEKVMGEEAMLKVHNHLLNFMNMISRHPSINYN